MYGERDQWFDDVVNPQPKECAPEVMDAEDPLFILYTSGSTGKPKGVLHTSGGYLVYASITHELVFDLREDDVFWCTADVGWVTGHSYVVYGPLANGATTVMFEGVPNYPDCGRFWQTVDKHKVTLFYTAPTAIRALMREGEAPVKALVALHRCACSAASASRSIRRRGSGITVSSATVAARSSIRGGKRKPAAFLIIAAAWRDRSEARLGDAAVLRRASRRSSITRATHSEGAREGNLVITDSWPGQMRTVSRRSPALHRHVLQNLPGQLLHRRRCAAR